MLDVMWTPTWFQTSGLQKIEIFQRIQCNTVHPCAWMQSSDLFRKGLAFEFIQSCSVWHLLRLFTFCSKLFKSDILSDRSLPSKSKVINDPYVPLALFVKNADIWLIFYICVAKEWKVVRGKEIRKANGSDIFAWKMRRATSIDLDTMQHGCYIIGWIHLHCSSNRWNNGGHCDSSLYVGTSSNHLQLRSPKATDAFLGQTYIIHSFVHGQAQKYSTQDSLTNQPSQPILETMALSCGNVPYLHC